MNKNSLLKNIYYFIPVLLLTAAAGIAPFIEAFQTSFYHDIYGQKTFAGLENYFFLRQDSGFRLSVNITALWSIGSALLSVFTGFILASMMTSVKKLSKLLYGALLIPWGIPVYIAVPLWRALIHGNGGNSVFTELFGLSFNLMMDPAAGFISCLAVNLWLTLPFTVFIIHGAISRIPVTMKEAAEVDGADRITVSMHVIMPQIKNVLITMGILNFIKAFKEFSVPFLMTAGGPPLLSGITDRFIIGAVTTLDVFIYDIFNTTEDMGISSAYSVMTAGLIILLIAVWYISGSSKKSAAFRFRILSVSTALIQLIFSGLSGGLPALGYLTGLINRKLFYISALIHFIFICIKTAHNGFLSGFDPGIIPAVYTAVWVVLQHRRNPENRKTSIQPIIRGLKLPAAGLSLAASGLIIVSSAVIIYLLLWMSFSGISACFIDGFLPPSPGIESYREAFSEHNIIYYFKNTIIVSALTGVLTPLVCFPAAMYLNSRGKVFTGTVLAAIQLISIAGGMHSLIPLYEIFRKAGLVNSFTPLIIIGTYHAVPVAIFTITAWLDRMPDSFRDAALVEGMKPFGYLIRVLMPLSIPVIVTSFMAAFISAWNSFMVPLIFLNEERLYTISIKIYSLIGSIASGTPSWNIFAAVSVLNCLIIVFIFSWFRKPAGKTGISEVMD